MVGFTHDSNTLRGIWDRELQKVKTQSDVVFDEIRNAHMSCQHVTNEIDVFGLPEDEKYVEEIDTGDKPFLEQDSHPTQLGKRSRSHMHEAPDKQADNAHSRRLR